MLKVAMCKIKKICSIALIPRILRDEMSLSPRKLGKRPIDGLWRMSKSTDSKDKHAQCEKCKKLIEMFFGPEKPSNVLNNVEANLEDIHMDKIQRAITSIDAINGKSNEPDNIRAINLLPVHDNDKKLEHNEIDSRNDTLQVTTDKLLPLDDILTATTAKIEEERLAQKIETIEEPGLVETAVPKIEDWNHPSANVLGDKEDVCGNSLCTKIAPEYDAMDDMAKKCLGSPPDKIDEHILDEMKSCGMLERGGRKRTCSRSGYHHMKSNEKNLLSETNSEQNRESLVGKQKSTASLNDNTQTQDHNTKFASNVQEVYFDNVPLCLIDKGRSVRETDEDRRSANAATNNKDYKPESRDEVPEGQDSSNMVKTSTVEISEAQTEQILDINTQVPIEVLKETISLEQKPTDAIENVDMEVEEIRVTAAETSRLGVPEETEFELDVNREPLKPNVLPYNQILQALETPLDGNSFEPHDGERIVYAEPNHHIDVPLKQSFNGQNTAISSTYPQIDPQPQSERSEQSTSISSVQNPAEFYDISHCHMEKLGGEYALRPSSIRSLTAYHPYTILSTGEDVTRPENILFAIKDTPNAFSPELNHVETEREEVRTIRKSISAATVPLSEELEEEIPLTEMLRRVRERNRQVLTVEPEANKCPPPKGPPKTLDPGPCKPKPKPKPACPPPPPPCPPPQSPCKPKDPCAKCTNTSLVMDKIMETFTLVLQVVFKSSSCDKTLNTVEPLKDMIAKEDRHHVEKIIGSGNEDVTLARDFEPWAPIPSWPIPVKEKKGAFVCPKEGCKIIPPPLLNPPCKENPCVNLPKRKFSLIALEYGTLYSTTFSGGEL